MCVCEVSTCMWYRFSVLCDGIGNCVCVCGVAVGMGVVGGEDDFTLFSLCIHN